MPKWPCRSHQDEAYKVCTRFGWTVPINATLIVSREGKINSPRRTVVPSLHCLWEKWVQAVVSFAGGGGFFLAYKLQAFGGEVWRFIPCLHLLLVLVLDGDQLVHTNSTFLRPGLLHTHSGSAGWDDCGQVFQLNIPNFCRGSPAVELLWFNWLLWENFYLKLLPN